MVRNDTVSNLFKWGLDMDRRELKKLRRQEFIIVNILALVVITIYFVLLFFPIAMSIFFMIYGTLFLAFSLMEYITNNKYPMMRYLFPSLKPLYKYNMEKLEIEKNNSDMIFSIVIGFILIFIGINWNINRPFGLLHYWIWGLIVLCIFAITNLAIYSRNEKVNKNTHN